MGRISSNREFGRKNAIDMLRLNDILETVRGYHAEANFDLIKKAYVYSAKVHQGQVRKSGEPYLVHPLEVSGLLAQMRLDEYTIAAGILHDTIEDTLATAEDLRGLFGPEVAEIVEGVTKLANIPYSTSHERAAENFRRMLVAMAKDIRVVLVKLADRLHNMRTLEHMKPEKQEKIAQETLDIYAPLANRLGINWLKAELQDLCLRYIHPNDYALIESKLAATAKDRESYIGEVKAILQKKMAENEIPAKVEGRVKSIYSIFKKLRATGVEFEDIHDIVAFRIITDTKGYCYGALGLCHEDWRPVPNRIKDFIATPKPNGYQSLHTTVIGPDAQRIEIQIRTQDMHRVAELGIAAHWRYKEGLPDKSYNREFNWLRGLMDFQREVADPTEFYASVKFDLFGDSVYVFTPRGEVKELRAGATPIDFAFAVHSEVGHHCHGAKVNGRIVPLRYRLKNGDTIEIITSPAAHPTKDWLPLVRSGRARNKINAYLRQEQRKRAIAMGTDILERELKRYSQSLQKCIKKGMFSDILSSGKNFHKVEDILAAIGYGKLTAGAVCRKILPAEVTEKGPKDESAPKPRLTQLFEAVARKNPGGIRVQGLDDLLVHFAKCCSPIPGDPIIGFVTRGRGVTVHARECAKALLLDPERKVEVDWDRDASVPRSVTLRVITEDRPGILATITGAFTGAGINIINANCRTRKDARAVNTFIVAIKDVGQLRTVMRNIEALQGIHSIERTQN